jgi:phosphoenolpyruvate synthase/pyruvate phosphate dikinase
MELIKPFTKLGKDDASIAGGKGASLGEMTQAGIPVPPGFVVLADAFERFIIETGLIAEIDAILAKVNHREMHTVEHASETIQALILNVEMPSDLKAEIENSFKDLRTKYVAVRSSATAEDGAEAAWAGQLDTFLNTTEETLLRKVQECWASLFTPRAIFYRFEKGMDVQKISVAVVVQKMVNSDAAGIAFSVHPVTEDYNQMIIEAGFGLGEAVVSGQVTPDSYVVTKEPLEIIEESISEQTKGLYRKEGGGNEWKDLPHEKGSSRVLSQEQIFALANVLIRIENHYGFPVDTEWAMENGELYIVQSRPITTLTTKISATIDDIEFNKVYTRDTTIIMQEFWGQCCSGGLRERYGINNPNHPEIIHFMNQGSIEIWENGAATKYLMDAIYERNIADENFMSTSLNALKNQVTDLKKYWDKNHAESLEEFEIYIDKARDALTSFIPYYYSAVDERTPAHLREKALEYRNEDFFFANSDTFIRNSLAHLYPEVKGFETTITTHELKNIPAQSELEARLKHMTLIDGAERTTETLAQLQARRPELHFIQDKIEFSGQEIKGQIAYKGIVRGKVKLLRRRDQLSEVQEGDIIVSPMTTPDFLPAMEKAAAFVTDEGGITCHAGIVAREMQKPCIIGTKIATQVLKDGDEVEVDADKGVIRILSTHKQVTSKEYLLTFEGKGLRALLSEIVSAGYLPPESLVFYQDETYKQYYSLKEIERMGESGKKFFTDPDATKQIIQTLEGEFKDCSRFFEKFKSPAQVSLIDIEAVFETFIRMNELYAKFDFAYTDKALLDLGNDHIVAANLKLVEKHKNELREEYNKLLFVPNSLFILILQKLSKQFSVSVDDLQWYLRSDLPNLYKDIKLSTKQITERQLSCVFHKTATGKLEFISGEKAVLYIKEFGVQEIKDVNILKGVVVHSTGKTIRGRAYVLDTDYGNFKELKKRMAEMEQGEILVAPTTAPEHMDAIRKASAIVVDIGGLLSHTAIVSRELGIPSVVGTQYASKIIKTGDQIEVDTSEGLVRVVKKDTVRILKKEDIVISDWEFEAQQRGEQPIFLCDLFSRSLDQLIYDMTGEVSHYDYLFTDSDKLNHSPRHRDIVLKKLREDMLDTAKRQEFLRNSIEIPKSFNAVANEVEAKIRGSISNKELAQLWREMDRDFLKVIPWFYYPWYVSKENMLTDQVKAGLENHRKEIEKICELDEALLAIVFPVKKTNFQLEQDEMLGLVTIAEKTSDFANDPEFRKHAAEYLKKYDYLTTFILTPVLPMTYEQLVERVAQNVRESFKDNYSLQKEATKKNEGRAKQLLEVIKDDKEIMMWVEDSRELGYVLTAGIEEAYMSSARYLKFIQLVAERIGVAFEDTKYLLSNEIATALEEDRKISAEVVDERREGFILMIKDGVQYAAFGKEGHALSAWIDGELNKVDMTIREFTGQRACKGFAKGRVRIATTPSQAHLLEEGEILVCPMTNPDYVPAMRRSAAIITDEGGLLSHAAIMSREFGKPCVIATKIATQLLKTGDMVEVDADSGVIKILN